MTTYKRVVSDWLVAAGVGVVAILLGVMGVKSPVMAIGAFGLVAMVVAGAVDVTLPTLAWLAVAPFVQAVETGSPLIILTLAFHRVLLPVVGLSALLGSSVRRQLKLVTSEKLLLVFLVYAAVSLYVGWDGSLGSAEGAEAVRTFLLSYVVPFGGLLMATRLPVASHRKVLAMLSLVAAAICAGGVLQSVAGRPVFPGAAFWQDVWDPRAVGSMGNPAVSAYVAQVGIFTAMFFAFREPAWRWASIPAVLVGAAFTILTYTRSAWVAFGLGVIAVTWFYKKARPWVVAAAGCAVLAFTLNIGGFVDSAFLEERAGNQENVEGRFAFGTTGFRMFKDQPFVGQGFGRYDVEAQSFAAGFGTVGAAVSGADTSHNTFLTILAELGLIGFLLYGAAIYAGLRGAVAAVRGKVEGVDRLKIVTLLAGVIAYFVSANLIDMRFFSFAVSLFWFTVGLVASSSRTAAPAAPAAA